MALGVKVDMTQGSLWDKIVLFAIPVALMAFLQQLFNAADVAVLGQFAGTNAMAAAAMKKAGAHQAASGENPTLVACRKADVIIGPIGIVIADALFGEVTPRMAAAVGQAEAIRILIPMNRCENLVAGVPDLSLSVLAEDVLAKLAGILGQN